MSDLHVYPPKNTLLAVLLLIGVAVMLAGNEPLPRADKEVGKPRHLLSWGKEGDKEGEFRSPIGIAINAKDEVFITEFHAHRVQKFNTDGKFLDLFQVAKHPGGIAVDAKGLIYVAAMLAGKICVYDPKGKLLHEWGKEGGDEGDFREPGGVTIGPKGTVFVADQSNHRIQVLTTEGKFITQWGEYGSKSGQFGGKGKAKSRLSGPHFLAFDRLKHLYTTEGAHGRIQKFTADGKYVLSWGNNSTDPGGFGGRSKDVRNPFPGPIGVAVDEANRVWVSSTNNRVQVFSSEGKFLGGFGEEGDGPGQFMIPHGMAFDSKGRLYVVDSSNHRVQQFAP